MPPDDDVIAALRAENAALRSANSRLKTANVALAGIVGDEAVRAHGLTWREGFAMYLVWYAAECRASSLKTVKNQGSRVLASPFVDKPIHTLTYGDLEEHKARRRAKPSYRGLPIAASTLDAEICLVLSVINWLAKPGRQAQSGVLTNPVSSYPMESFSRNGRSSARRRKTFSVAEEAAIIAVCAAKPVGGNLALRALIACELNFLRPGEALSLGREQFVDIGAGWCLVELRPDQTKNGKARSIPLSPSTMDPVRELPGWRSHARRPFENPVTGRPYASMSRLFDLAREEAGVPAHGRTLYSFRATGATRAIQAGVPLLVVAELMGHQDAGQTIQDHYNETTNDARIQAMQMIEASKSAPVRHPPLRAVPVADRAQENRLGTVINS